jgi:hypothetical protein
MCDEFFRVARDRKSTRDMQRAIELRMICEGKATPEQLGYTQPKIKTRDIDTELADVVESLRNQEEKPGESDEIHAARVDSEPNARASGDLIAENSASKQSEMC